MLNNFVSQAGTMQLHGIPVSPSPIQSKPNTNPPLQNDIMQNIDPITVILFIPIFDRIIYPAMRKAKIQFKPITRITWGFIMGSLAMTYAAILQNQIYNAGPCFKTPLKCAAGKQPGGKVEHNNVHVAYQTPAYFFIAISEIFASITGLEYGKPLSFFSRFRDMSNEQKHTAYTKAPQSMKSFIMSLFLLTNAGGALLGMAISPIAKDPNLIWLYTGLAGGSIVAAAVFWILFNHYNDTEDSMNEMDELDVVGDDGLILMEGMVGSHSHSQPRLPPVNKVSNFDIRALMRSDGGEAGQRLERGESGRIGRDS